MTIRVIIADDEVLMRSGLRLLLGAAEDVEIVAEAANGSQAIELVRAHRPDLVLMDVRMPVMDGLEATRHLMAASTPPQVLILTAFGTDEFVLDALRAGAAGYILKDTPPDELIHAVRTAAGGTRALSPDAVGLLLNQVGDGGPTSAQGSGDAGAGTVGTSAVETGDKTSAVYKGPRAGRSPGRDRRDRRPTSAGEPPSPWVDPLLVLTAREREIAEAVARGLSNAEVAAVLFVSVPTVKTHLARIFEKLEIRSRVQLALLVNS